MPPIRRRELLGAGAAALAGATLAGCTSSCPDRGRPTPDVVVTPADDPTATVDPTAAWPSIRHDPTNTGFGPDAAVPTDAALAWRTDVAAGEFPPSPPALAGSLYVVDGGGTLRALAPTDGSERWSAPVGHEAARVPGPPTVAGDLVVVAGPDGVHAVDVASRTVRWRRSDLAATAPATVAHQRVFVPTEGELLALSAPTGDQGWSAPFDGPVSRPAVAEGVVLANGAEVAAHGVGDGTELWRGGPAFADDPPVVVDGTAYVGSFGGLAAYDLAGGDRRWTFARGDGRGYAAPVVTPDTVYAVELVGEGPDAVFALDPDTGEPAPRWCSHLGEGTARAAGPGAVLVEGPPAEGADAGHAVGALTRDAGRATWQFRSDRLVAPPALADGVVYLVTAGGAVCALGEGDP